MNIIELDKKINISGKLIIALCASIILSYLSSFGIYAANDPSACNCQYSRRSQEPIETCPPSGMETCLKDSRNSEGRILRLENNQCNLDEFYCSNNGIPPAGNCSCEESYWYDSAYKTKAECLGENEVFNNRCVLPSSEWPDDSGWKYFWDGSCKIALYQCDSNANPTTIPTPTPTILPISCLANFTPDTSSFTIYPDGIINITGKVVNVSGGSGTYGFRWIDPPSAGYFRNKTEPTSVGSQGKGIVGWPKEPMPEGSTSDIVIQAKDKSAADWTNAAECGRVTVNVVHNPEQEPTSTPTITATVTPHPTATPSLTPTATPIIPPTPTPTLSTMDGAPTPTPKVVRVTVSGTVTIDNPHGILLKDGGVITFVFLDRDGTPSSSDRLEVLNQNGDNPFSFNLEHISGERIKFFVTVYRNLDNHKYHSPEEIVIASGQSINLSFTINIPATDTSEPTSTPVPTASCGQTVNGPCCQNGDRFTCNTQNDLYCNVLTEPKVCRAIADQNADVAIWSNVLNSTDLIFDFNNDGSANEIDFVLWLIAGKSL